MITRDTFRMLSDEERAQYKFRLCESCPCYECELIGEYEQFQAAHQEDGLPLDAERTFGEEDGSIVVQGISTLASSDDSKLPFIVAQPADGERRCATQPSDASVLSYDRQELEDGCIMGIRHVYPIDCKRQKVSEGIGNQFKIKLNWRKDKIDSDVEGRWGPLQPVFISAQTGQGKNYFIENELIPYVRKLNEDSNTQHRVLILSNRLALRQQIKNHLKRGRSIDCDIDGEEYKIYPYKEYADVMTYQSLLRRKEDLEGMQKSPSSSYLYVICDEAHFFTSDAMFNPHTSEILSAIVRIFQNAVRVYMSATPYECLRYIIEYEREYCLLKSNYDQAKDKSRPMVFYHFQRSYSYLDVKVYSKIDELYRTIVESVNKKKEKWLIFIDDKEKGKAVADKLLEREKAYAELHSGCLVLNGGTEESAKGILAVDTKSKTNETYMEIVRNEALVNGIYVLITTSVLDNGINLKNIDNIVVSDMSKVKCLQMVGRARVSSADDRKTLYIKRFDSEYVERRIASFENQKAGYHDYDQAYGELPDLTKSRGTRAVYTFLNKYYDGNIWDWENAKCWFGRSMDRDTKLYLNKIARSLVDRLVQQYELIRDEMIEEEASADDDVLCNECVGRIGQKYLEYQLSWFGKTYCVDDDITFADKDKAKKAFVAFLESYAESKEEIIVGTDRAEKFQTTFIQLFDDAYYKSDRNSREYGIKKMNNLLKKNQVKYVIEGNPQSGPWTVIRLD